MAGQLKDFEVTDESLYIQDSGVRLECNHNARYNRVKLNIAFGQEEQPRFLKAEL